MIQQVNVNKTHHRILILGGGTAGIMTASLLRRAGQADIAILEPSSQHFYQPLWTLVGTGIVPAETTSRSEARYIPKGVRWIQDRGAEVAPDQQIVTTESSTRIGYDFLVVATGAQLNWNEIPGLEEAIRRGDASSNYGYQLAPKTWDLIRNFKGGTALFHMPGTPVKCPGAPQKIMYLAADYFRKKGLGRQAQVIYGSGLGAIYGVKEYAAVLDRVIHRYRIDARFNPELVEILPEKKEAVFQVKSDPTGQRTTIPYGFLHAVPPHSAPDFIQQSPLADPPEAPGRLGQGRQAHDAARELPQCFRTWRRGRHTQRKNRSGGIAPGARGDGQPAIGTPGQRAASSLRRLHRLPHYHRLWPNAVVRGGLHGQSGAPHPRNKYFPRALRHVAIEKVWPTLAVLERFTPRPKSSLP
jgi:Pyridine nucleotide-disulphide oxidoreductase